MKIDLHLHSYQSKRPSQWVLQKIGCPESFSKPDSLVRIVEKAGMDAMTLTDHNTISGALELAHRPNFFISEEITTYFPEDGCKVHVLAFDINERIHEDIQKVRENIYDLVVYLNQNNVIHSLAHPLFAVNDRLTLDHFEKFLLLFNTIELNGARDDVQNTVLKAVVNNLTRRDIEELEARHHLTPIGETPWKKHLTGGSDDHSALNAARMYTEVPGTGTIKEFLAGLKAGRSVPRGHGSDPETLAHNLYGIAYQFYNNRFSLNKYANQDVLMRFLDRLLQPEPQAEGWLPLKLINLWTARSRRRTAASGKVEDVIRCEGEKAITTDPGLMEIIRHSHRECVNKDERWFRFVDRVSNKVLQRFSTELFGQLSGANVFSIFGSIGAAGSLYSMLAPYFVSYSLFGRGRTLTRQVKNHFIGHSSEQPGFIGDDIKVAHFTDTFFEINGVAWTLRQQAEMAAKAGKELMIITCETDSSEPIPDKVKAFEPVELFRLPEYPEQKLFVPPFLEMLKYVYDNGFTYLHSATPGPIGLAALAIARILDLPISGTYHTALPQYAAYLTGDAAIEQLVWRYTIWYYDQMEMVYVPSRETGKELIEKGIDPKKILVYPRGVDTRQFHPGNRNGLYEHRYGIKDKTKLLFVGRVSKEKNLPLLVSTFKKLNRTMPELHLVIVGDGPYLAEMRDELKNYPCTFTGYLTGTDLAEAYAGADIFIFPSTTDTFGNVILEAQASGLPVIVTDVGGPLENITPGRTGLVVPGNDMEKMAEAIRSLARDPFRLKQMAKAARTLMETRSFEQAFLEHWSLYTREQVERDQQPMLAQAS